MGDDYNSLTTCKVITIVCFYCAWESKWYHCKIAAKGAKWMDRGDIDSKYALRLKKSVKFFDLLI